MILSKTPEQHIEYVRIVLSLLNSADVTLKIENCSFFTNIIDYLGHVVRSRRLVHTSCTAGAIRNLKPPSSVTEMRSFLELYNFFR